MSKLETALSRFKDGFSCSQAVLAAFAPQLGMDEETAIRLAGAFGGGVAHRGGTCGAVNAAFMVIGLKYSDIDINYQATKKTFAAVRQFIKEFENLNGSIVCKDLINCDISTSAGIEYAIKKEFFSTVCPKFVKDSIEILEYLLQDQQLGATP